MEAAAACGEGGGPRKPQCKMKSYLMERFFNEPVEALDKRLESAESNLNSLPMDPFTEVKQEELEEQEEGEHPLDYSEVQVASPPCPHHLPTESCSPQHSLSPLPPTASSSPVQRVTIQTSSGSPPPGWRVSPVPWRALLAPEELSPPRSPPPPRPSVIGPNPRWSTEPPAKRLKMSPVPENRDQIDSRILATEASGGFQGNPLSMTSSPAPPDWDQQRPVPAQGYLERYRQLAMEEVPKRTSSVIVRHSKGRPVSSPQQRETPKQGKAGQQWWEEGRHQKQEATEEERLQHTSEQESLCQERLKHGTENMRFAARGRPGRPTLEEPSMYQMRPERPDMCDRLYPGGPESLGAYDRLHGGHERLRDLDRPHQERPDSQRGLGGNDEYGPKRTEGQHNSSENGHGGPKRPQGGGFLARPGPPFDERQWLSHLQQLRAGFAYRMMEAHHGQQRPQPGSWPPPPLTPQHRFHGAGGLPQGHPLQVPRFPGAGPLHQSRPSGSLHPSSTVTSLQQQQQASPPDRSMSPASPSSTNMPTSSGQPDVLVPSTKGKRGRPRKHAPKLPLPPLYVFIR